jgi:hypothetical protein
MAPRFLCLILLSVSLAPQAVAHGEFFDAGWTAAERRAGFGLQLTMARIKQLATINGELRKLAEQRPETCRWMNQITGPETLARQVIAFDDYSTVRNVIEHSAMSAETYLLTLYAISETAIAVHDAKHGVETTASASPPNISFYRAHRIEIETLLDEPDPCDVDLPHQLN